MISSASLCETLRLGASAVKILRQRPKAPQGFRSVTCLLLVTLCLSNRLWSETILSLSNGQQQLVFDAQDGRWLGLIELTTKQNLVSTNTPAARLWHLQLAPEVGAERGLAPTQAASFRVEGSSERAATLIWETFHLPEAPQLRIRARVELSKDQATSDWHLVVENLGSLQLRQIHFPRLHNLTSQKDERLAVPAWMGQLAMHPRDLLADGEERGRRMEFDYPGHTSLQCLAWYQEGGPGFYLSCDDTRAFRKSFVFEGDADNRVHCWLAHLPENALGKAPRRSYELPYRVVIGTFHGDWYTAAERYRDWATAQAWASESRLRRHAVAPWVSQTALWVWNRGRSSQVLKPAVALQKRLGLPVSVFWHWWHGCSYDTGFPEYLPPREGSEPFAAALQTAHKQGVHAIVYMNQRLWGMTTASWQAENAQSFAVKGADGKIHPEIYNTFTRAPCASMCLHTPFWRNKYAGLAADAVLQLGVDGIYMDQACSSRACFDPTHGHPLGGGTYWMAGFRALSTDIRRRCDGPDGDPVVLAGEGVGESWLPQLDLMLSLQVSRERYAAPDGWEPIPFFQAVYHPLVIQYGNYSSLTRPPYDELWPPEFAPTQPLKLLDRKFSSQFCLEQARAFVWGQQPTLANFRPSLLEDRPDEMTFVLRLARVRQRALKYLLHGTFLRPPNVNAVEDERDMSRLSIYAGQRAGLSTFRKRIPRLLAAAYRAADGSLGIAMASLSATSQTVQLRLETSTEAHPSAQEPVDESTSTVHCQIDQLPRQGRLWKIDENARVPIGRFSGDDSPLTVSIPAHGAYVIELTGDHE